MLQPVAIREDPHRLAEVVRQDLHDAIADLMKLDPDDIRLDENLGELGFDSISLTELATVLNQRYQVQILPSVFYACNDILSLADHLVEEYEAEMEAHFGGTASATLATPPASPERLPAAEAGTENASGTLLVTAPPGEAEGATPPATEPEPGTEPENVRPPAPASEILDEMEWFGQEHTSAARDSAGIAGAGPAVAACSAAVEPAVPPIGREGGQVAPAAAPQDVAVIGISGIFPGSPDLESFWQNLVAEADLITEVPESRWDWRDFFGDPATEKNKMRCKWGGFIDGVDLFDAEFFKISPREAVLMDPQHRLFLLTVWRALEDAGYRPSGLSGRAVGVFAGAQFNDYQTLLAEQNEWSERATTGCAQTMLVNRVSYLLNLRGPCEAINTACSSSLVAVHRAVNAIRSGEVELALAGGVGLVLSPYNMLSAGVLNILSPEGRCKTFDASADGYVKGEGVGVVLLKPLARAQADGDHIYAVIRGSAVNHGGHATSLTAPNPSAQAEVVTKAIRQAGIGVETIGFIETHGTGTKLGDPVEIEGLRTAFAKLGEVAGDEAGKGEPATGYCGLGAVKANIGHLEPAAGIAGLLKIILALVHRTLPGTPHLRKLNPYIELNGSPFFVVEHTQEWPEPRDRDGKPVPRRAGVSSFGFGGTNAHVVLEEAPTVVPASISPQERPYLFVLSARDEERLRLQAQGLLTHIERGQGMERVVDETALCEAVLGELAELVAAVLGMDRTEITAGDSFRALGLDTLLLATVCDRINARYRYHLGEEVMLWHDTLESLLEHLWSSPDCNLVDAHPECVRLVPRADNAPAIPLAEIAYTLQVGREEMAARLAFAAADATEVVTRLTDFLEGRRSSDLICGRVTHKGSGIALLQGEERVTQLIGDWVQKGKIGNLAKLWVEGFELDWSLLYPNGRPRRVALPTYPFALTPYWYSEIEPAAQQAGNEGCAEVATPVSATLGTPSAVPSREDIEQVVTRVWQQALGVPQIGRDEDFLELGGDSIISTRIINQLEQELSFKLPAGRFLQASTIAAVSEIAVAEMAAGREQLTEAASAAVDVAAAQTTPAREPITTQVPAAPTIPRRVEPGSAPLSSGQERFWFLNRMFPNNTAYNVPAALLLHGILEIPRLEQAYHCLIERHEALRSIFNELDGAPVQKVHPPFAGAIEFIELQAQAPSTWPDHLRGWLQEPFDLTRCPLLRVGVARLGPEEHVVKVVIHHIISDVWSVGIVLRELLTIYGALVRGTAHNLPEQSVHFGDYADWQQRNLEQVVADELPYWVNYLKGAPELLPLPLDRPRPGVQTFAAGHADFSVPAEVVAALKELSRRFKVSLYVTVLAAFNALLARISGLEDIMVGTPVANRGLPETENMVGFLANTLVLRNDLSGNPTFGELVERVRTTTFGAYDHQQVPFSKVVEAVKPKRATNYNPLFQVMFNMFPPMVPTGNGRLGFAPYDVTPDVSDYDLMLRVGERGDLLGGALDYNRDLFQETTIEAIAEAWLGILQQVAREPDTRLNSLALPPLLTDRVKQAEVPAKKQTVVITSTFVAEPLQETLEFWMNRLDMPARLEFAQYNQVFPQLLDPNQHLLRNRDGVNLVLVRLHDWVRFDEGAPIDQQVSSLRKTVDDFIDAVRSAAASSTTPLVVACCPSSVTADQVPEYQHLEARIATALAPLPGVYLRTHDEVIGTYPVGEIFDARADKQAHIPFTPDYYCALGTMLARTTFALRSKPYKVIAVDCDNTLWRGVVGEDGVNGIEIDPARRRFQQLLIDQQQAGVLLCLCSKNAEADVFEVLDQRSNMLLRREHLISHRINWQPKSRNLAELAAELNLGSDSFMFIDDNPVECSEMRANRPEVLTLQLPQEPEQIDTFLRHAWAFDRLDVTDEDARRTQMYRQNISREQAQRSVASFADFLASLELQIDLQPVLPEAVPRVSQLTYRTNQFNFTTRRRSESEIRQLLGNREGECLTVSVRDRFGEYGLVGVVIFGEGSDELVADIFLLSCRVLGKGVEHWMVARLGEIASERGLVRVVLTYLPSPRNTPALDFLSSLAAATREPYQDGFRFVLAAGDAATVRFAASEIAPEVPTTSSGPATLAVPGINERLAEVSQLLSTVVDIRKAVQAAAAPAGPVGTGQGGAPRNQLERTIARTVCEMLGVDKLGLEDNFFDLGAHSSVLVQVAGKLEVQLGRELPVMRFFQYPTVSSLARYLDSGSTAQAGGQRSRRRGEKQRRLLLQLRQTQEAAAAESLAQTNDRQLSTAD